MNYHVFLFWPEQAKPSGHDEAAVLKPKLPLILCKLLMIDTYTPRPTRSGWKHENYMWLYCPLTHKGILFPFNFQIFLVVSVEQCLGCNHPPQPSVRQSDSERERHPWNRKGPQCLQADGYLPAWPYSYLKGFILQLCGWQNQQLSTLAFIILWNNWTESNSAAPSSEPHGITSLPGKARTFKTLTGLRKEAGFTLWDVSAISVFAARTALNAPCAKSLPGQWNLLMTKKYSSIRCKLYLFPFKASAVLHEALFMGFIRPD